MCQTWQLFTWVPTSVIAFMVKVLPVRSTSTLNSRLEGLKERTTTSTLPPSWSAPTCSLRSQLWISLLPTPVTSTREMPFSFCGLISILSLKRVSWRRVPRFGLHSDLDSDIYDGHTPSGWKHTISRRQEWEMVLLRVFLARFCGYGIWVAGHGMWFLRLVVSLLYWLIIEGWGYCGWSATRS